MPRIRLVLMVLFAVACSAVAASEPTVEELNRRLSDEDTSKVADAAEALGKLGTAAGPAIPNLVEALADDRETPRMADSVPGGFKYRVRVSRIAGESIQTIGRPAVRHLIDELKRQRKSTFDDVLLILRCIGRDAEDAHRDVLAVVDSPVRHEFRLQAVWTYCAIAPRTPEVLQQKIRWIDDLDPEVRSYAIESIALEGPGGGAAVPALIRRLSDETLVSKAISSHLATQVPLKQNVCQTLGEIGPTAAFATPRLTEIMATDEIPEVRVAAALAVCQIEPKSVAGLETLITELKNQDDNNSAKDDAAWALASLKSQAQPAWGTLVKTCREDADDWVRHSAVFAITEIDPENAVEPLMAVLINDPDASVRVKSAECLGVLGQRSAVAVPHLVQMLDNDNLYAHVYGARDTAATALGQIGPAAREAIPQLEKLIDSDAGDWTKEIAREAIRRIRDAPPRPSTEALKP